MDLYNWTKEYISFKDIMKKQIEDIKFLETMIFVKEKNDKKIYFVFEKLSQAITALKKIKDEKVIFVSLNTKENVDFLIKSWDLFSDNKNITLIFVHPQLNEKWLIHPSTHNKISERKVLKESIYTLFESIGRV